MLIRLSPKPTRCSILSVHAHLERSWLSTYLSEKSYLSRTRFPSFSDCFRMNRRVRPILSVPDGVMDSSVITADRLESRTDFPIAPAFCAASAATAIQASLLAPSWNVPIRHFQSGFGLRIWLPARRPVCRLFSSSANSDCRVTKPLFRYFTSCASAWCAQTKIRSAASLK